MKEVIRTKGILVLTLTVLLHATVSVALAGVNEWTGISPDVRIDSIAFSPNYGSDPTIFASKGRYCDSYTSDSYKSTDDGTSWSLMGPGGVLAISPSYMTDNTLFVGGNSYSIFKSTDGGSLWIDLNPSQAGSCLGDMAISPDFANDQTVFSTAINGVYKSSDGGLSWTNKGCSGNGQLAISPNFATDQTIFYANLGVFKSIDGGSTWTKVSYNPPLPDSNIIGNIAISPNYSYDKTIFVALNSLFKSDDEGTTWAKINDENVIDVAISSNYAVDKTIFAALGQIVYRSVDGGYTLNQLSSTGLPSDASIIEIVVSPNYANNKTIFAGTHRGVYVYTISSDTQADAGDDQTVDEGSLVTLDGSGSSDPDNDPLTYLWKQIAGYEVTLDLSDPVHPIFSAPWVTAGVETLTFELIVNDGKLDSDPDYVNITVKNVNNPPIADAGGDQTVNEESLVMLYGSGSYDPDGDSITYSWVQPEGPQVSLSGDDTATPSFTAPLVASAGETLTFELTVSDGIYSASDTVNVVVENVNHQPTADAGPDQTVDEGVPITLHGSDSSDPDNDPLTYAWVQIAGTSVSLSNHSADNPTFTAPSVGPGGDTLEFQLIVNDGELASKPDEVIITVLDSNDPPACGLALASPERLWPPNHKMVPVKIVGVADPDNEEVTINVTGVTQDEPVKNTGEGDTSSDAVIQGDTVLLRAERAGDGNGRVYQVTFTADDGSGGICTGTVTVCVPHDPQNTSCVDDGQIYDSQQQ